MRVLFLLAVLGVLSAVAALVLLMARGVEVVGDTDQRLDERASFTSGELISRTPVGWPLPDDIVQVDYRFRHGGREFEGACFVPELESLEGPCTVEFVSGSPEIHRIRNGVKDPVAGLTRALFGVVLLPSVALLLLLFRHRVRSGQRAATEAGPDETQVR